MSYTDKLMMGDPRETNLPKWAQDTLKNLRNRLIVVERDLEIERSSIVKEQDNHVAVSLGFESTRYYPDDCRVLFRVGKRLDEKFELYVREETLFIYGGTVVNIKPSASNAIQLKLEQI